MFNGDHSSDDDQGFSDYGDYNEYDVHSFTRSSWEYTIPNQPIYDMDTAVFVLQRGILTCKLNKKLKGFKENSFSAIELDELEILKPENID